MNSRGDSESPRKIPHFIPMLSKLWLFEVSSTFQRTWHTAKDFEHYWLF